MKTYFSFPFDERPSWDKVCVLFSLHNRINRVEKEQSGGKDLIHRLLQVNATPDVLFTRNWPKENDWKIRV
jgi:hypothetical protein